MSSFGPYASIYAGPEKSYMFLENQRAEYTGNERRDRWSYGARVRAIAGAFDAYNGDYLDPLVTRQGEANPNLELNFARLIVNKTVAFLFGQELTFDTGEAGTTQGPAEQALDQFWRSNSHGSKMTLLQKLALNGSVSGHCAAKFSLDYRSRGKAPALRLRPVDPASFDVVVNPDERDEVWEYVIRWSKLEGVRTVYRRQRHIDIGGSWIIRDEWSYSPEGPWLPIGETDWPYPFSAIVDCQNLPDPNCYFGYSDIEDDVLRIVNRMNFITSDWNKALRLHAHPREWGKNFDVRSAANAAPDSIVDLGAEGEMGLLEMRGNMSGVDLLFTKVKEALHQITRIPEVSVGKLDSVGRLSAVAMEIMYQPLLELTYVKRGTYGGLLADINARVLHMAGQGAGGEVKNVWPALLPSDPKLLRELAVFDELILQIASRETIAGELGRDWDQEQERLAAEPTEAPLIGGGFSQNDLTQQSN